MEPISLTNLLNVLLLFLMLAVPVIIIAYGVATGLRLAQREATDRTSGANARSRRVVLALIAIIVGVLWLVLSFNTMAGPGLSPLLVILPVLLILLVQFGFWVLIIAGVVWLVLWLARRTGIVSPARESPLEILKMRYARGEITAEQFDEMKHRLQDI